MTTPMCVIFALHPDDVDEASERPITDEDGRTVQLNTFVRNGPGEVVLPGCFIKGAIRTVFEEHTNELGFSEEEPRDLWGGEMHREVGIRRK